MATWILYLSASGIVPSDLLPAPVNLFTKRRAAIGYLDIILVCQGKKPRQTKSSYWLPGCYTCPPTGEVPSVLLPPPANRCTERRAPIGYLDIILVRQWEKSHKLCSLLQPTVVQKRELLLTTWILYLSASRRNSMSSAPSSSPPLYRKESYIDYLDVILVCQREKFHELCSLLQPTVVQKLELLLTTWMFGCYTCPPVGEVP